jgi:hemerythrin-like domain-containing protein
MTLGDRLRDIPASQHCGGKAVAVIGALIHEHEQVLALISDVRTARLAGDLARQADLARQIAAVLGPHQIVEHNGLFPALAADYPDPIGLLEAEHRKIEAPLAEAVRAMASGAVVPADPSWPDRLARALALLRDHMFKEQDALYPAALAILRSADWDAIEAIRAAAVPARLPAMPGRAVVALRVPSTSLVIRPAMTAGIVVVVAPRPAREPEAAPPAVTPA